MKLRRNRIQFSRFSAAFSPAEGSGKSIRAIDDEQNVLELIQGILARNGYAVDPPAN